MDGVCLWIPYYIYPLMNYIIPLVAPSLQEFFLANRGGYHNSQINGAISSEGQGVIYTGMGNEVPRLVTNLTDFFEENKEFSMILGKIWNFNVVSD